MFHKVKDGLSFDNETLDGYKDENLNNTRLFKTIMLHRD